MKLVAMVMFVVAACGTDSLPAGAVCKQTSECESGLMCLDVAQFSGTSCTVVSKACSITCTDDSGCASLGSSFRCFAGCGAEKFCGMIAQ